MRIDWIRALFLTFLRESECEVRMSTSLGLDRVYVYAALCAEYNNEYNNRKVR